MQVVPVSRDLLVGSVISKLSMDQDHYPQSPERVKVTLEFKDSAFYSLYGVMWLDFLKLRRQVNVIMSNPTELGLHENKINFLLVTDHNFPKVAPILVTYLNLIGWKSVTFTNTTHTVKGNPNSRIVINVELSHMESK